MCIDFSKACDKAISHRILTDKIEKCQPLKPSSKHLRKVEQLTSTDQCIDEEQKKGPNSNHIFINYLNESTKDVLSADGTELRVESSFIKQQQVYSPCVTEIT